MKTRLLVMVGMIISTTIFAQKSALDSRKSESKGYERMKRELALSGDQYASVKNIDSKYSRKKGEQRAKFDMRRFEERETMRSLRLEREREMRKVFTPDQSKKWDEDRSVQKSKHHRFEKGKHKHEDMRHKHSRKDRHDGRKFEDRKGFDKKGGRA